jgi:hypothetical protein
MLAPSERNIYKPGSPVYLRASLQPLLLGVITLCD